MTANLFGLNVFRFNELRIDLSILLIFGCHPTKSTLLLKKAIEAINFRPGLKVALKFSDTLYHNAIGASNSGERSSYDIAFGKEKELHILQ